MTEERKVLTKEEWEYFLTSLSGIYGRVELLVDGFKVNVQRQLVKKNSLANVVYVNGKIKGEWYAHHKLSEKNPIVPEETRRFFRQTVRAFHSAKRIAEHEKAFGKRFTKKHVYYDKLVLYTPLWSSATTLKRHLLKHNHNIEIVKEKP